LRNELQQQIQLQQAEVAKRRVERDECKAKRGKRHNESIAEQNKTETKRDECMTDDNKCQAQTNSLNADSEDLGDNSNSISKDEKGKSEAKEDKFKDNKAGVARNNSVTDSNTSQAQMPGVRKTRTRQICR
jgi:hypothetical protein